MSYPTKKPQRKAYIAGNKNNTIIIFNANLMCLYSFGKNRHARADTPKIIPIIEDFISKNAFAIKKVNKSINNTFNNIAKIFNVDTKYLTMKGL